MTISKDDLHKALEEQSKTIITVIDSAATDVRNDKLENTYSLETQMRTVEKKLGIKSPA